MAAVKAGQSLHELAAAIPETGEAQVDQVLARLKAIPKNPAGSDLKALRQTFLPWSWREPTWRWQPNAGGKS